MATLLAILWFMVGPIWADTCGYCGREASPVAYSDGRRFCQGCLSSNVFTEEHATRLQGECFVFLTATLGPNFPCSPMKLLDRPEFDKMRLNFRLGPNIEGIFAERASTVYMLSGLRPANFQGLMVHEYTHAWQQAVCPRQEESLKEGFATLIQYKWLMSRGQSAIAKSIAANPDPRYGKSMATLQAREKQLTYPVLLDRVQRYRKLAEI